MLKVPATFEFENSLWKQDKKYIVGIDEVGRGAWAGPLVAAAVIFPKNFVTKAKLYDSKLLTSLQRENLSEYILRSCLSVGFGQCDVAEIVKYGLSKATQMAYERALEKISLVIDHYLIDAFYVKSIPKVNQTPILHGDYFCGTIAAASIVAKVYRDNLMKELGKSYLDYNFHLNKGYGTRSHRDAILKFGLSPVHRTNYNLKILNV